MSDASINTNVVQAAMQKAFGGLTITRSEAQNLGIDNDDFEKANTDQDENTLSIKEALEDDNIYEQFATMCLNEQDTKNEVNKEKEKEKDTRRMDKNQAKS